MGKPIRKIFWSNIKLGVPKEIGIVTGYKDELLRSYPPSNFTITMIGLPMNMVKSNTTKQKKIFDEKFSWLFVI